MINSCYHPEQERIFIPGLYIQWMMSIKYLNVLIQLALSIAESATPPLILSVHGFIETIHSVSDHVILELEGMIRILECLNLVHLYQVLAAIVRRINARNVKRHFSWILVAEYSQWSDSFLNSHKVVHIEESFVIFHSQVFEIYLVVVVNESQVWEEDTSGFVDEFAWHFT